LFVQDPGGKKDKSGSFILLHLKSGYFECPLSNSCGNFVVIVRVLRGRTFKKPCEWTEVMGRSVGQWNCYKKGGWAHPSSVYLKFAHLSFHLVTMQQEILTRSGLHCLGLPSLQNHGPNKLLLFRIFPDFGVLVQQQKTDEDKNISPRNSLEGHGGIFSFPTSWWLLESVFFLICKKGLWGGGIFVTEYFPFYAIYCF
jgi:hypothetical protein